MTDGYIKIGEGSSKYYLKDGHLFRNESKDLNSLNLVDIHTLAAEAYAKKFNSTPQNKLSELKENEELAKFIANEEKKALTEVRLGGNDESGKRDVNNDMLYTLQDYNNSGEISVAEAQRSLLNPPKNLFKLDPVTREPIELDMGKDKKTGEIIYEKVPVTSDYYKTDNISRTRGDNSPKAYDSPMDYDNGYVANFDDIDPATGEFKIRNPKGQLESPPADMEYDLHQPNNAESKGQIYFKNGDGSYRDDKGVCYTKDDKGIMSKTADKNYYVEHPDQKLIDKENIKAHGDNVKYIFNAYRTVGHIFKFEDFTNEDEQIDKLKPHLMKLSQLMQSWDGDDDAKQIFKYDIENSERFGRNMLSPEEIFKYASSKASILPGMKEPILKPNEGYNQSSKPYGDKKI